MLKSLSPEEAWAAAQRGELRLLDLRTAAERRRHGAPPGAVPVSFLRHLLRPEGPGAVYFCAVAGRSKLTLRRGAQEVGGGFRAWRAAGLPVQRMAAPPSRP